MSALFVLTLALRRFRLGGAAKLGLLLIAAQAALFDGVILRTTGDLAHAGSAVAAPAAAQPQKPSAAQCREETITLDEGYGLRGQETRVVCGR
ncbi:MAG TPA: hypothetical protein VMJ31_11290 [Methylocystis sp.]|nr:hypothetical protein [Methylocystis sp.]